MDKNKTLCLVKLTLAQRDALRECVEREETWASYGSDDALDGNELQLLTGADVQLEFAEVLDGIHE